MEIQHELQKQLNEHRSSMFNEGYLDNQFRLLQQLEDESNPDFVKEIVSLFFEDSEKLLNDLSTIVLIDRGGGGPSFVDFNKIDAHVHQLKGSSASIGVQRVKNACLSFHNICREQNLDGCLRCMEELKQEYLIVKEKLETLFTLEKKVAAAAGAITLPSAME